MNKEIMEVCKQIKFNSFNNYKNYNTTYLVHLYLQAERKEDFL
ncbi:hypothetical protein [Brachyspira sp. G79]|nr:hypothetical protein [Brachyspira sp. G79]